MSTIARFREYEIEDSYARKELENTKNVLTTSLSNITNQLNITNKKVDSKLELLEDEINNINDNIENNLSNILSGTPLIATSIEEMTDTTRIYVNSTDGHWYYYSESNWIDGGVYQATVDEESVKKLKFEVEECIGKFDDNLFNKNNVLHNTFFKTSANKVVGIEYSATVSLSNPIPVSAGDNVNITFGNMSGTRAYAICNSKNDFTSNEVVVYLSNGTSFSRQMSSNGYLVVAFFNEEIDSIEIKINEKYQLVDIADPFKEKLINMINVHSKYKGKTFSFIGDSITFGYNTTKKYTDYIYEKLDLLQVYNYGINGSTISDKQNSMATRCISANNSDVIIVFGGTNDFGCYPTIIGELYTESNNTKILNYDNSTFAGAMNTLCQNLLNTFTGKEIYILSPIHRENFETQPNDLEKNSLGLYIEEYVDCMKECCRLWGIKFFDMLSEFNFNPNIQNIKTTYFHENDGLHLNELGHEKLAETIINLIEGNVK